jgi:hypothetical protein
LRTRTEAKQGCAAPPLAGSSTASSKGSKRAIRLTLGELVEAVAAVTVDATEQAAVVNHILGTRGGNRRCLPEGGRP